MLIDIVERVEAIHARACWHWRFRSYETVLFPEKGAACPRRPLMLDPRECEARERALTDADKMLLTAHAREKGGLTHKWQVLRYTAHLHGGIHVQFRLPPRNPDYGGSPPNRVCEVIVPLGDEEHAFWCQALERGECCEAGVPHQGALGFAAEVLEDACLRLSGGQRYLQPELVAVQRWLSWLASGPREHTGLADLAAGRASQARAVAALPPYGGVTPEVIKRNATLPSTPGEGGHHVQNP